MLAVICILVVKPDPFYSAQYMIPLAGMLLGNSLGGNIVTLQNFFTALSQRKDEYEAAISLGASVQFATLPFLREAIQKSLAPTLASMATNRVGNFTGNDDGSNSRWRKSSHRNQISANDHDRDLRHDVGFNLYLLELNDPSCDSSSWTSTDQTLRQSIDPSQNVPIRSYPQNLWITVVIHI